MLLLSPILLQNLTDRPFFFLPMDSPHDYSSSFSHKLRSSLCLTCCFPVSRRSSLDQPDEKPRLVRASSAWIRSRANEFPEFKEKWRNMFNRIGRRRRHSSDFQYDPLSYALNFDEGAEDDRSDEFPIRIFSARLPVSSPEEKKDPIMTTTTVMVSREITAFS